MFKKPYILKHILKTVSRQAYLASRLLALHASRSYPLHGFLSPKGKPLLPKQFDTDINHHRIIEDAFIFLYLL
jgi:hypothetical protein